MKNQELTRENILKNIHFQRNINRIIALFLLLLLLQFLVMIFHVDSFFLTQMSLLVMFVLYMWIVCRAWHKRFGRYDIKLDDGLLFSQILWVFMMEHFQNVEFNDQKQIPEKVIRFPAFPFAEGSYVYWPDRYATAQWGTTPLEVQHMRMGTLETGYNLSDGAGVPDTYETLSPSFDGMIYLCHLGRPFTPTMIHMGKPLPGEIKTGDAAFDKLFSLRTKDLRTMPLTEGMRRYLTEAAGKIQGKLYIHFASNGDIYLAFDRVIYNDRPRKDTDAFDKLDPQAWLVKGLLDGLTGGF